MESKHRSLAVGSRSLGLLIEPVWNRNKLLMYRRAVVMSLLIEPVWNRNSSIGDILIYRENLYRLLIEPVWNRNLLSIEDTPILTEFGF